MFRQNRFLSTVAISLFVIFLSHPHAITQDQESLSKVTQDVDSKFTNVSKYGIGLTITNYGTIGTRNYYWSNNQPSCEYPRGSRIEHIYQGGLWIGALMKTKDSLDSRNGQFLVTTGTSDQVYKSSSSKLIRGYEFNAEAADSIIEFSNLEQARPPSSTYSPDAVSHQDFVCDYSDKWTRTPVTSDSIEYHIPLGIEVHQESYTWNYSYADFYVILRYVIKNASLDTLDSVYVGFWNNAVVRNTNLVRPGTPGYFNYTGQGYVDSLRMAYSFDFNGTPGETPANSYFGFKLLGTTPFPSGVTYLQNPLDVADTNGTLTGKTYYNAWYYPSIGTSDPYYQSPTDDWLDQPYPSKGRYSRMTQKMPRSKIEPLRVAPYNVSYLLSTGPFTRIYPDSSIEVVFAAICAKKDGNDPPRYDSVSQRKSFYTNASWAQKTYDGNDLNHNGIFDPDEDILGTGKIVRYLQPSPPRTPTIRTEVESQSAVIYWDNAAEQSIDPNSGKKDFEGYRIYRSVLGLDVLQHDQFLLDMPLVGDFDLATDSIGYNTGFSQIALDTPVTFPGDTTKYYYRFPPKGVTQTLLNGWQYIFGITSYDKGDSSSNVDSRESPKAVARIVPGTAPTSNKSTDVRVYPNPYYVSANWDGSAERLRKIYFYNLPVRCEIRVYTLAGDVVTVIQHDAATYGGEGIKWFDTFGDPNTKAQFAGGEHAWDLISQHDQAIATGLYLFTVEDKSTGDIKRGKFMIIK
jgi:hypothetical protein